MIITRTPFRISFVGGGSDLESFYSRHKGAVISTSINKYMYISSHKFFEEDTDLLIGVNIGFGFSKDLSRWAIRPDFGFVFNSDFFWFFYPLQPLPDAAQADDHPRPIGRVGLQLDRL